MYFCLITKTAERIYIGEYDLWQVTAILGTNNKEHKQQYRAKTHTGLPESNPYPAALLYSNDILE
jgi:hypothetical protein